MTADWDPSTARRPPPGSVTLNAVSVARLYGPRLAPLQTLTIVVRRDGLVSAGPEESFVGATERGIW